MIAVGGGADGDVASFLATICVLAVEVSKEKGRHLAWAARKQPLPVSWMNGFAGAVNFQIPYFCQASS